MAWSELVICGCGWCVRMGWQEDRKEHARLWNSALHKVMKASGEDEVQQAYAVFNFSMRGILEIMQPDEALDRRISQMFACWFMSDYLKNGEPAGKWYVYRAPSITPDEKDVLLAGLDSRTGFFRVERHEGCDVDLMGIDGKRYAVETIDLPKLKEGIAIFAMINAKGNGRHFFAGPLMPFSNDRIFADMKKHEDFRNTWSRHLAGFVEYQMKELALGEKTADRHMEDVNLLMFLLERKPEIDGFEKVTKGMLNTELKAFIKRHIFNKVDMDKAYYSLRMFFDYLEEKHGIKNLEASGWLRGRTA